MEAELATLNDEDKEGFLETLGVSKDTCGLNVGFKTMILCRLNVNWSYPCFSCWPMLHTLRWDSRLSTPWDPKKPERGPLEKG